MSIENDTIAAIATPPGVGALAVIRVSGVGAIACAARLFRGARSLTDVPSHTLHHGLLCDVSGALIDDVVAAVFRAPHSYTGEESVEVSCHGGAAVARAVLAALLASGARHAEPGEFTRRAFVNGRLDLAQAEAVADLIHAQSDEARLASIRQLQGALSALVTELRGRLSHAAAMLEIELDFVEDDVEFLDRAAIGALLREVIASIDRLLAGAAAGIRIRDGVRVAFVGRPNAGKSSLFNALLQTERAIVTPIPGTTRDWLEEPAMLRGRLFRLIDTAGLRDSDDAVERAGVALSAERIADADIVCLVLDATTPEADAGALAELHRVRTDAVVLVVRNKIDLVDADAAEQTDAQPVSALTGRGCPALSERLAAEAGHLTAVQEAGAAMVTNVRHADALQRARAAVADAEGAMAAGLSQEFAAADLRRAIDALGEIIGVLSSADVLDAIFARFCIGK